MPLNATCHVSIRFQIGRRWKWLKTFYYSAGRARWKGGNNFRVTWKFYERMDALMRKVGGIHVRTSNSSLLGEEQVVCSSLSFSIEFCIATGKVRWFHATWKTPDIKKDYWLCYLIIKEYWLFCLIEKEYRLRFLNIKKEYQLCYLVIKEYWLSYPIIERKYRFCYLRCFFSYSLSYYTNQPLF